MLHIWRGIRFGMLLQLAIGPVCLLVFDTSVNQGIFAALKLVAAAALVDAFYIFCSGLGVAKWLQTEKASTACRICGGCVLLLFGADMLLGALGHSFLPSLRLFSESRAHGLFFKGVLLTASNPLTIVFWSGVFSAQMAQHRLCGFELLAFGGGCVAATCIFLGGVAFLGGNIGTFLPQAVILTLNLAVGCTVAFFGLRLLAEAMRNKHKAI